MKNLDKTNPFNSITEYTNFGKVTILTTEIRISEGESISIGEKTLLANKVYKKNEIYDIVYTIIN